MSVLITNNLDPNNVGTPSSGNLVLFSGPDNLYYYKKPNGDYFPLGNGGFNTTFSLNPLTYDLTITDGNGTLTASLIPLASGYFNTGLSFNTASNVLSVTDAFGSVTASLSYYEGGFNQNLSYNTASNVLSLTDGNSTLTASLTTGGANNAMTFNPFTNILSVTDGFGSVTASLAALSLSSGSTSSFLKIGELDYTELNVASYSTYSTYGLTNSNSLTLIDKKVLNLYYYTQNDFVSASGSVNPNIAFLDSLTTPDGGGTFSAALYTGNHGVAFFEEGIGVNKVSQFISNTQSVTFRIALNFLDNSNNSIENPKNWSKGRISFVLEYENFNLLSLPF